jgi:hypothetical protein
VSPARSASPTPAAATKPPRSTTKPKPKPKKRRRAKPDRAIAWARRIARYRPRLLEDTLDALRGLYGPQEWRRRLDPTS